MSIIDLIKINMCKKDVASQVLCGDVLYHALDYSRSDYIDRKIIYVILLLLIMLFHVCYEFLLSFGTH